MNPGTRLRSSRSCCLEFRVLTQSLQRRAEEPGRRLLTGSEQVGGDLHHVLHRRKRAVGKGGGGQPGHDVVAWLAPAVFDVGGELRVQVLERAVGHLERVVVRQLLKELLMILVGHAKEVGDNEHGVGLGVLADELTCASVVEPVDLVVGQLQKGRLVFLQALGCDQPHQEAPLGRVFGRVERGQLVAEGKLVPVGLDDLGDIVSFERDGELGEGPDRRNAGREGRLVVVDGDRLVVAGHHVDVVERLLGDRASCTQVVEVGVGVLEEVLGAEEIDRIECLVVAHWCSISVKGRYTVRTDTKNGRVRRMSVDRGMFRCRAGLPGDGRG